jgi:hypothetical protein
MLLIQPESMATLRRAELPTSPTVALAAALEVRSIVFPVVGDTRYGDTFGACRDGCSRAHKGVDIFAPKLTPLVAATDGTIVRERRNDSTISGNTITIEDDDGWRYIYVHLNNDTPGTDDGSNPQSWIIASDLRAGDRVRAGQLIGYLGDSGNAETTEPHLHFEIHPPGGPAINPTGSVSAADESGNVLSTADLSASVAEEADWEYVVEEWYDRLLDREPSDEELQLWAGRLGTGQGTEADLVADLALAAPYRQPDGTGIRLHLILFGYLPDGDLLDDLADLGRDGATDVEVAERLLDSPDARDLLHDGDIADLVGEALADLGIDASLPGGDPAAALAELAATDPVLSLTWPSVLVTLAYRHAAGRMPDDEELEAWTEHLDEGGLLADVVAGALDGDLPSAPPANGDPDTEALGYQPGVSVRQGPVLLDPEGRAGAGPAGSLVGGDVTVDYDLTVDGDEDSDTASLVVEVPVDELAGADGTVELSIELSLTRPDDPDEEPTAEASVDVIIEPGDDDRTSVRSDADRDGDRDPAPTARTTTSPRATKPATVRPRSTDTTTRTTPPTTRAPSTTANPPPTTATSTTAPPITTPTTATTPTTTTTPPTCIVMLSPGITISVPSGRSIVPVTSVVRKKNCGR